ncbi:hypothetical protein DFO66_103353 [Brevibacterium sanguinis]|uniref:Uncharacterized protein n=2 Tax=Brevibacterium TaxID=1696 RepID=A0A366ILG1_9MICO|nr:MULTISPECIES: hypothetical protein [Brevibacterium]RBP66406.1 hypothetical protein DFO66_103353 [Brevibacterium sanguinis]RBP73058.1 hypothetical protein DFO65_103353 [Brevibacterium celere]
MSKFGIQAGILRPVISVGQLNKDRTVFTQKADMTDEVLLSVAEYAIKHFGGALEATYAGESGSKLTLRITAKEEVSDVDD